MRGEMNTREEINALVLARIKTNGLRHLMYPLNFADVWNAGAWEYLYAQTLRRVMGRPVKDGEW